MHQANLFHRTKPPSLQVVMTSKFIQQKTRYNLYHKRKTVLRQKIVFICRLNEKIMAPHRGAASRPLEMMFHKRQSSRLLLLMDTEIEIGCVIFAHPNLYYDPSRVKF